MRSRTTLFSMSLLLAVASTSAIAHDDGTMDGRPHNHPSAETMIVDALVARPLGIIATVVGAATWVVSLPFSLPSGSAGEAAHTLVGTPARYTFNRPLGEFPNDRDSYYHASRADGYAE